MEEERTPGEPLDTDVLFRRYAPFVARFLTRLGAPRSEVDDLVQEVFLVAHSHGGWIPAGAKPTTWLARIAIRLEANAKRKRRRRDMDGDSAVGRALGPADVHALVSAAQSLTYVEQALGKLDLDQRALFVLYEIERESCDAIAAGLGVPVGTVYSRLHKARTVFREAFEQLVATPVRSVER